MLPRVTSCTSSLPVILVFAACLVSAVFAQDVTTAEVSSNNGPSLKNVVQAVKFGNPWTIAEPDFDDSRIEAFARRLTQQPDLLSQYISNRLSSTCLQNLKVFLQYRIDRGVVESLAVSEPANFRFQFRKELDDLIQGENLYEPKRFAGVKFGFDTQEMLSQEPDPLTSSHLNRLLLEDAYPFMKGTSDRLVIIPGADFVVRIDFGNRVIYSYDWNGKLKAVADLAMHHSSTKDEEKARSGESFSIFEVKNPRLGIMSSSPRQIAVRMDRDTYLVEPSTGEIKNSRFRD